MLYVLTGRTQNLKVSNNSANTVMLRTGAPQGCMLHLRLFALLTYDSVPTYSIDHIDTVSEDTTVLGFITNNVEANDRKEVNQLH